MESQLREMSQLRLLSMKGILAGSNLQRPTDRDEDVRAAAIDLLLPKVLEWLRQNGDDYSDKPDEIRQDLLKICRCWSHDGFELAKELADLSWSPDAQLVEILDGFSEMHDACRAAVKKWVEATNPQPLFRVGARVSYKGKDGTVVRVDPDVAQYVINVPADGHDPKNLFTGWVVDWESLELKAR
jgi:hypothetical protein